MIIKVLFIGDIVGKVGRNAVKASLPHLLDAYKIDLVIANGENIAGGFGLTESLVLDLYAMGVHVITTGNHVWDKKDFIGYIAKDNRVLRPANFAPGVPGYGRIVYTLPGGTKVGILNLSGRVFMTNMDCPFRTAEEEIRELSKETKVIVIDLHAEATSEKIAFGYFVDGRASAVIGTHTHVQTADEKILPQGTAYITDVGMTGPVHSVIGIEVTQIIRRFLTGMPDRFETAQGKGLLSAVVVGISTDSGKAESIQRIQLSYP
jgi:metallophosphoesterase (TIGR00282 family)